MPIFDRVGMDLSQTLAGVSKSKKALVNSSEVLFSIDLTSSCAAVGRLRLMRVTFVADSVSPVLGGIASIAGMNHEGLDLGRWQRPSISP